MATSDTQYGAQKQTTDSRERGVMDTTMDKAGEGGTTLHSAKGSEDYYDEGTAC